MVRVAYTTCQTTSSMQVTQTKIVGQLRTSVLSIFSGNLDQNHFDHKLRSRQR